MMQNGTAQATAAAPATGLACEHQPALVDAWYAKALADQQPTQGLDAAIAEASPGWLTNLARRHRLARGLGWFLACQPGQLVVAPFAARGLMTFLAALALSGKPCRLVLIEFLRAEPTTAFAHLKEWLHVTLLRRLLRQPLMGVQVMTPWEATAYAEKYRLPAALFRCIPFPMTLRPSEALPPDSSAHNPPLVLASGRAACDWPTLFEAARGASWPLTVVCSAQDRPRVEALNHDGRATVLSEISPQAHDELLRHATVYALVLREQQASSGQVRLARCIEAGIPVVSTAVRGLEGYAEPGVTALCVPVADPVSLRAALDALVLDAPRRASLRESAHRTMRLRSLDAYVEEVGRFVFAQAPRA